MNVLSFERVKWGGVRHEDPEYQAFDLARLAHDLGRPSSPQPTAEDWDILRRVFAAAAELPPGARPGDLDRALAGVLRSNRDERRALIQILAYAGVLPCGIHRSYATGFVPAWERPEPPSHKNDWTYPAAWWRGAGGAHRAVDVGVARRYFPACFEPGTGA